MNYDEIKVNVEDVVKSIYGELLTWPLPEGYESTNEVRYPQAGELWLHSGGTVATGWYDQPRLILRKKQPEFPRTIRLEYVGNGQAQYGEVAISWHGLTNLRTRNAGGLVATTCVGSGPRYRVTFED